MTYARIEKVTRNELINHLQYMLNDYKKEAEEFGLEDRTVRRKFDAMIACKEMVEVLLAEPVNLRKDGTVTVGF